MLNGRRPETAIIFLQYILGGKNMRRNDLFWKRILACAITPAILFSSSSVGITAFAEHISSETGSFMDMLEKNYKDPKQQFQTETRWWLAEGAHTDETIIEEIETMHEQGFTGFELCMLDERSLDSNIYAYGSEEWSHDVKLAIETASKYGMSVGLTSGTHWKAANIPGLDPNSEAAGQEVGYSVEKVPSGTSRDGQLALPKVRRGYTNDQVKRKLIGVYAYRVSDPGSEKASDPMELDKDSMLDLTAMVTENETLDWTAPSDGDYVLYGLWQQGTFQVCEPAQEKAFAINYFDESGVNALKEYLASHLFADEELVEVIKKSDIQFFMDSLEIETSEGGRCMYWTQNMADEFQKRKGYDIRPYLPLMIGDVRSDVGATDPKATGNYIFSDTDSQNGRDLAWKIKNDFYDVCTNLLQEKMMIPLKNWAQENYNMELRAQISYGTWIETSEMSMGTDYSETETLQFKDQVDMYRLTSGGAHILDQLLSSETAAIFGMNYALSEQDYLKMSYAQYAAGVNRIIWHGHSSSWGPENSISWPGYEGMYADISGRLDVREPNSADYSEMNDHLGRIQQALREGISQVDLGILHLGYGEASTYGINYYDPLSEHKGIYWKDLTLQDAGYTYDYFSPAYLEKMTYDAQTDTLGDNVGYRAILLNQKAIPFEYAERLLELARQGLKVVIVDKAGTVSPYNDKKDRELAEVLSAMKKLDNVISVASEADAYEALQKMDVHPRAELVGSNAQILTQVRKDGDNAFLFVYNYCNGERCGLNHGVNAKTDISMDGIFIPYYIDTWTGKVEKVADYRYENGRTIFTINLNYNDAALYAFESVDTEELHAVATTADKILNDNGTFVARTAKSGEYTTTLSDGSSYITKLDVPKATNLTGWKLKVEDWKPGDKIYREEKRETTIYQNGERVPATVTTREAKIDTKKDIIETELFSLKTWDSIPDIGRDVSGIGYYSTEFEWDTSKADGAYLDLGKFPQSAAVSVNGKKADPVNVMNGVVDISGLLKNGSNTLDITMTTTLTNRLLEMGRLRERSGFHNDYTIKYFSNGLSAVTLIPFAEAALTEENEVLSPEANLLKQVIAIYSGISMDGFTADSVQAFQKTLSDAKAALENKNASARDLSASLAALIKAADGLTVDKTAMKNAIQAASQNAEAARQAAESAKQELEKAKFSARSVSIRKVASAKKKRAQVTWKKVSGADGYVIQHSTNSKFKHAKSVTIKKGTAATKLFKKLKSGKRYFVRVKAYKHFDGKKIYTRYSAKKSVRVR